MPTGGLIRKQGEHFVESSPFEVDPVLQSTNDTNPMPSRPCREHAFPTVRDADFGKHDEIDTTFFVIAVSRNFIQQRREWFKSGTTKPRRAQVARFYIFLIHWYIGQRDQNGVVEVRAANPDCDLIIGRNCHQPALRASEPVSGSLQSTPTRVCRLADLNTSTAYSYDDLFPITTLPL